MSRVAPDLCFGVWSPAMPSPADFSDLFDPCKTARDVDDAYHTGIGILQEAMRLAHQRLEDLRDERTPKINNRTAPAATEAALKRSYDATVKRWAAQQGIPFKKVSKKLRELYEEAHGGGE